MATETSISKQKKVEMIMPSVCRITVKNLFGHISYQLPRKKGASSDYSRFMILYGENGSGKTTILRLFFSLLATSPQGGQKTLIARIPFQEFVVEFNNGDTVGAHRSPANLIGQYDIRIGKRGKKKASFTLGIIKRLDAQPITSKKQLLTLGVPYSEGKHPS